MRVLILTVALFGTVCASVHADPITTFVSLTTNDGIVEWTFDSQKYYADPFNDVDFDVTFSRNGQSWRVPAFWRGETRWTVRFAPPDPGDYMYRLESSDMHNPALNGLSGHITIDAYAGDNSLLRHGMLRVSANKRHFESTDGTPFYWLGDTLWTGLSDRLPWDGFQVLVADRREKGFTVMQICAGLVPTNEEKAPIDPGYSNEGGAVWDAKFERINPKFFDYADRRIKALIDAGIAPAIFGGWYDVLAQMGVEKMKKHWRYLIGRYGAYSVFWVAGGELFDPPTNYARGLPSGFQSFLTPGWTEIVRYIRRVDPYHHPLAAHETFAPFDVPLQDETLTDFDLSQPSHFGWASIAAEVAQLNTRYSRTDYAKPVVVSEIGYELLGATNLADFQRVGFWLAMINGAAGHTYGAGPTYEANNPDKPLHRRNQFTFYSWQEGLTLPGSYQVGLGAELLRNYAWWQFSPHPEWITPRGTTLLEPHAGAPQFDWDQLKLAYNDDASPTDAMIENTESVYPVGEWNMRHGSFRKPYATGVPGKVRVIYIPYFGLFTPPPPTVLALEPDVHYSAYYWDPMLGIKFGLGAVSLPAPGAVIASDKFEDAPSKKWSEYGPFKPKRVAGRLATSGDSISVLKHVKVQDGIVATDLLAHSSGGLLLRYQDNDNYVVAMYSAQEKMLYLLNRSRGVNSRRLGVIPITELGSDVHLSAEVRFNYAQAIVTDGDKSYATPIVDIISSNIFSPMDPSKIKAGLVGLLHQNDGGTQQFVNFEVRQSPTIAADEHLNKKLYDARGTYRGELRGPGWDDYGKDKIILLNSYRPERFPATQDWVLVLDAEPSRVTNSNQR